MGIFKAVMIRFTQRRGHLSDPPPATDLEEVAHAEYCRQMLRLKQALTAGFEVQESLAEGRKILGIR